MLSIYNFLKVKLCYRTYWKQWLAFLAICFLIFACSDDSGDDSSNQTFLEIYDGVKWNWEGATNNELIMKSFSTSGIYEYYYTSLLSDPCIETFIPWGIVGDWDDFSKVEIVESTTDELVLEATHNSLGTVIQTIRVYDNGNSIQIDCNVEFCSPENWYRVTESNVCD